MTADAADAALQQARLYLDVDNHQRAREVLAGALSMAPDDPVLLILDAQAAVGLGDHIGAERRLYAALKSVPDNEHAIRLYALALRGQGRLHEAKWMAWRAVCGNPNEYRTHLVYAQILSDEGWLDAALTEVTEAIRLEPSDPDLFVLRGNIFRKLSRTAESDAEYTAALRLQPDHANATHNLAVNRMARGRLLGALRGFLGAGTLDPALGGLARRNIALAMARWLRWCTVGVLFLLWLLLVTAAPGNTLGMGPRVGIAVVTVGLGAALGKLVVTVGRRTLASALKSQPLLAVRLVIVVVAVVLGALTTVSPRQLEVVQVGAPMLLVVSIVLAWVSRFTRH
ncbi:tetratricopeptide repeat protein [Mycobacterium sp. PDNC021]|uniref:tetratricopeptide repeat protein n=1 Tax=Mycobacterium sp. PDNC021 TaxID=3391399 RepID=UPI003AAFF723